jgi:hypothetical protein
MRKIIPIAYKLELSDSTSIDLVFHVSQLKRAEDAIHGRKTPTS